MKGCVFFFIATFICPKAWSLVSDEFMAMGTTWRWQATDGRKTIHKEAISRQLIKIAYKYETTFSEWSKESEYSKLAEKGFKKPQFVSNLFIKGFCLSVEAYKRTQGAFDISVLSKKKIKLTDFYYERGKFSIPQKEVKLTWGGIIKGMALGQMAECLKTSGLNHFSINAGNGNSAYYGSLAESVDEIKKGQLVLLSFSKTTQKQQNQFKQHIFNPHKRTLSFDRNEKLICYEKENWVKAAALSDAWSTALTVNPKLKLPSSCRRLRIS